MSIAGQSVIITGASSGIGEAAARLLKEKGAKIMLAARREERLAKLCGELGELARYRVTDVTSHKDMVALGEETVKLFGKVDVMINNAGTMPLSPLAHRRVDEWDQMVDVNIKGVLYGIDAVLTHMLERGSGHIINVSSVAGLVVNPASAVYAGTKFAVRAISEGLRKETVGKVRVTTIYPGAVSTELGDTIKDEVVRAAAADRFNFPFLEAGDVAEAIAFAVEAPPNMAVNDIVVRPAQQPH